MFICKHNRFRSKVAESIFIHYTNGRYPVRSRGLIKDIDVHPNVVKALRVIGVKIGDKKSHSLSADDFKWADLIVITADNVPSSLFDNFNKKIIVWKIKDTVQEDYDGILERVEIIEKKVKKLINEIENNNV